MTNGEKFKKIRKQRKYSIVDLSKISGSRSSISAFENNQNSLSTDTLFQLLTELMVTPEEFFDISNYSNNTLLFNKMSGVTNDFQNSDTNALLKKSDDCENEYKQTGKYLFHILSLNIRLIAAELDKSLLDPDSAQEMLDYFFSIDVWTNFDIGMWGNVVNHYSEKNICLITKELIKELPQNPKSGRDRIIIDSITNGLNVLIERRDYDDAQNIISQLEVFNYPPHFMYQITSLKLSRCYLNYNMGNVIEAYEEKEKLISALSVIFSAEYVESWIQSTANWVCPQ